MKKVIAIVAGGDSSEHDVSLRSAAGIQSFMDTARYDCYIVEMKGKDWTVHYGDERCPVDRNDFSFTAHDGRHAFDFAYITIHGTPGENGILQGYFDLVGVPYSTSDVLVEALTFNKFALNQFLRTCPELNISDSLLLRKGEQLPAAQEIANRLGLPCFVKPNAGGSSFGVTKAKTVDELYPAIARAMNESDEVMVERLMSGTEITCGAYKARSGQIVGTDDDHAHTVHQIAGEGPPFVRAAIAELIVGRTGVLIDVALRVGGQLGVLECEQAFQIVLLHVLAEEARVLFPQRESWLGLDTLQFVALLQQQRVQITQQLLIGLQVAQHGDQDGQ